MDCTDPHHEAFDLLKLAWKAGVFLKKVSTADNIALEVLERVERLRHVTDGVRAILQRREEAGVPLTSESDVSVETKINESLKACVKYLQALERRVGRFDDSDASLKVLVNRFKVAWRHSSICKGQNDLEARISILQTNLIVLQL